MNKTGTKKSSTENQRQKTNLKEAGRGRGEKSILKQVSLSDDAIRQNAKAGEGERGRAGPERGTKTIQPKYYQKGQTKIRQNQIQN